MSILQHGRLVEGKYDAWSWVTDSEGKYTVKSTFDMLQGLDLEEPVEVFDQLWKGLAPSNALVFAWKAMWGRIQSKHNQLWKELAPSNVISFKIMFHSFHSIPPNEE